MHCQVDCRDSPVSKMAKEQIALCFMLAVQAISAYKVVVPVFEQPFGGGGNIRIVNGQTAERGQFPHQAAIVMDSFAFCGGALISKSYVLTAGHCISGYTEWTVDLGAHDQDVYEEPGRVTFETDKAIKHENYDGEYLINDIGLIALPKEVQLTDTVNIIALPPRSYQHENFTGKTVRVSGWGRTSNDPNSDSRFLQFTDLSIISYEECHKDYGNFVTKLHYCCVGENNKSMCKGDSGGALTIGSGKNLTHLGIASYGSNRGCTVGDPSGFTATTFYVDWISNKTGIPVVDF